MDTSIKDRKVNETRNSRLQIFLNSFIYYSMNKPKINILILYILANFMHIYNRSFTLGNLWIKNFQGKCGKANLLICILLIKDILKVFVQLLNDLPMKAHKSTLSPLTIRVRILSQFHFGKESLNTRPHKKTKSLTVLLMFIQKLTLVAMKNSNSVVSNIWWCDQKDDWIP